MPMGVVEVLDPVQPTRAGGWKVDVSRGERNGRVSSEWFNRPDDERYLSLDDLWANVKGRSERSRTRVVQTADIRVEAARDNPERLHLMLPKAQEPVAPTHWCQRRSKNRPRGGVKPGQWRGAKRHGARALQIAGACHGALVRRANSVTIDQVPASFRARLWASL
jgi:hypothetical protein